MFLSISSDLIDGLLIDVKINSKKLMWNLTWVRKDGVCLGQKLVTADSLVTFSTPGGETRQRVKRGNEYEDN